MADLESSGRECKWPSIMAPNESCARKQAYPQFLQSVLVSTCQSLPAAALWWNPNKAGQGGNSFLSEGLNK